MKVIWLKPHHKFAYVTGNICDLEEKKTKELIEGGFVKAFETPKPKPKQKAIKK